MKGKERKEKKGGNQKNYKYYAGSKTDAQM